MNIIDLPITIIDNIIGNINDTETYANIRLTCKSFYYLIKEIKRYYNNKVLKELFIFRNGLLNGYHIRWYINSKILSMGFYINSKKEKEYLEYYSSGNIKLVQNYVNDMLHGEEKYYSNYDQLLLRKCEYEKNKKINTELIYNIYGEIMYEKTYLNNNIVNIKYYNNHKIITGTFINNILHGRLIIEYFYSNNVIINYNKIIKQFNCGELISISKYKFNNLIEKFYIKNGKKNEWNIKWDDDNNIKLLCYYKDNKYNGKLKMWNSNRTESIEFIDNIPNGLYKSQSEFVSRVIPFKNNIMDGYVCEKINTINLKYLIKFNEGIFDHIIKKSTSSYIIEIFLDKDYFSYTKYSNNGNKILSYKLIQNYINFTIYDSKQEKIYDYSRFLHDYTPYTNI